MPSHRLDLAGLVDHRLHLDYSRTPSMQLLELPTDLFLSKITCPMSFL